MKNNLPVLTLITLSALFIGLFMTACPEPEADDPNTRKFWVYDPSSDPELHDAARYYRVSAKKLFEGKKCEIWAERGKGVTKDQAKSIANEYDNNIHGLIMGTFGIENFEYTFGSGKKKKFKNVMEFANYITNSKKLLILLVDIKDGYGGKEGQAFIGGYFSSINYFSNGTVYQASYGEDTVKTSNLTNMIYVDIEPGLEYLSQTYETLAHEMQHLASFIATVIRGEQLDLWIDEGMSTMAEYLYRGEQTARYVDFNKDWAGTIAQGNNFYVWDNDEYKSNPLSILDEYATAYMFFQWLYHQAGEEKDASFFKKINKSPHGDYRAIIGLAMGMNDGWGDWETLLRMWFAANYINDPISEFGYKNDPDFSKIIVRSPTTEAPHRLRLYPGEGVYSKITGGSFDAGTFPTDDDDTDYGDHVKYVGLDKSAGTVNFVWPNYTGSALLAFNMNTYRIDDYSGDPEFAYLTGEMLDLPPPEDSFEPSISRSLMGTSFPRVIDFRDAFGRQKTLPKLDWNDEE